MQNNNLFVNPTEAEWLFDELYLVKEKDFSIEFKYLGSNNLKLVLLVYEPNEKNIAEASLTFINNVVEKGLKKKPEDLAIVNLANYNQYNLTDLENFFKPSKCIFWGCKDWLNTHQIPNQEYATLLQFGVECIFVEPTQVYLTDAKAKAKLWSLLQKIFF